MTERKPPGMPVETWVEHQIARGMARGAFDLLPGAGKPLPRRTGEATAYDWAVQWARREDGDVPGTVHSMLPPGLALRKEREDLPRRAAVLPSEAAVRALAEDFDDRVRLYWRRPQEGPWVPVGLADVQALVAEWRRARPVPPPRIPERPPVRRRWLDRWRSLRRG